MSRNLTVRIVERMGGPATTAPEYDFCGDCVNCPRFDECNEEMEATL